MSRLYSKDSSTLLFIVNSTIIGGHEVQVKYLIKDAIASKKKVVILCPDYHVCGYFNDTGADVRFVPFNVSGKIWKQIGSRKITSSLLFPHLAGHNEVIVSGGSIEATIGPVMAVRKLHSQAHIVSYVPMYIDRSLTHGWVGIIYNCFLDIIAKVTSEYLTVNRIQAYIIKKRTGVATSYIPNRIRSVIKPKQSYGPRLVYIGRFDDQQKDLTGLITLLDHQDNPFNNLILIGDGPDRDFILFAAKESRHLNVEAYGWLSPTQIDEVIGEEDVLVLNSRWEGEPLVVREFFEKGLHCIARDIAGVRGLIHKSLRFKKQNELILILKKVHKKILCK